MDARYDRRAVAVVRCVSQELFADGGDQRTGGQVSDTQPKSGPVAEVDAFLAHAEAMRVAENAALLSQAAAMPPRQVRDAGVWLLGYIEGAVRDGNRGVPLDPAFLLRCAIGHAAGVASASGERGQE